MNSTGVGDAAVGDRRRHRGSGLRLAHVDLRIGRDSPERARHSRGQPAAAPGDQHRVDVLQLLGELEADGAVSGHDRRVANGVDEVAVDALQLGERLLAVAVHRRPPRLPGHAHHATAQALDGCELCGGRVVGDDDRGRNTERARHPRHTLGHVARARGHDSFGELGAWCAEDRVRGAAQLEGADRLQALELEPDLRRGVVQVQADERRPDDGVRDPGSRPLDVLERDQNSTSLPTPCSRARRTTSSAAARSSTAIPSDLKSVSSSSRSRPGCVPTSTSPSSALM